MAPGVEQTIAKLSRRRYNQGELPPSYIMGQSYAYLLVPFWLKDYSAIIYMQKNLFLHIRYEAGLQNNSQWPCSMCPFPQLGLLSYILEHPNFWTPLYSS